MILPPDFINRMNHQLPPNEVDDFFAALQTAAPISVRYNTCKTPEPPLNPTLPVLWCDNAYYLPKRPLFTADPLFHAGVYYVQEASSMFVAEALQQTTNLSEPLTVLDLCAAPGGKSTLLAAMLSPQSMLIANEMVRTRANILAENLVKWGLDNTYVCCNTPNDFEPLSQLFDVVLVDAPCSGEGMFRRGDVAINEWSLHNVTMCATRQQQILPIAAQLLKPGGILIYTTCTYAQTENEDNALWLIDNTDHNLQSVQLQLQPQWGITQTQCQSRQQQTVFGYRFYPHKVQGEGFFMSVFKKPSIPENGDDYPATYANNKSAKNKKQKNANNSLLLSKTYLPQMPNYVAQPEQYEYVLLDTEIHAIPKPNYALWLNMRQHLYFLKQGIHLGTVKQNGIIPAHDLALSISHAPTLPTLPLSYEQAIAFLRKTDFDLPPNAPIGWCMVSYQNVALGWIKVLPNGRANNYYPPHWRIRMEL